MSGNENLKSERPKTEVVHIREGSYDVYIGRRGKGEDGYFGNPFDIRNHGREKSLELYREYFLRRVRTDGVFREKVLELHGKTLGCFCKPRKCHGDIIAEWLEEQHEAEIAEARKAIAPKPSKESVRKAKQFRLKALAMKMTPEPVVTGMRTQEDREKILNLEKSRESMKALERVGGNSYD